MSKPVIAIATAVVLLGIAHLVNAAHQADVSPMSGDSPSRSTTTLEAATDAQELEEHSRYLRGWQLALTQRPPDREPDADVDEGDQSLDATTFAPEFYMDDGHVNVSSVAFGTDRFFALDAGRTSFPGWPCDEECLAQSRPIQAPLVRAYTTAGKRDANVDFEPHLYDAADFVVAIAYAAGKLYVMNRNPPRVYVYMLDGRRIPDEDFYLAGGERYREDGHSSDMSLAPADLVHAAGRFYVLDKGTNQYTPKVFVYDTRGMRIPEAEFRIDGLRFKGCDDSCEFVDNIAHADGILYVRVWVRVPGYPPVDRPAWLYNLDGSRAGTLHFDESARFTEGMTHANGWFYLMSQVSSSKLQRICAYTLAGQRVESEPVITDRHC